MPAYSYTPVDGHIVVNTGQDSLLLDTGSPVSMGTSETIHFCDRSFAVHKGNYMGTDIHWLAERVGCDLSGLVGSDILAGFDVLIDPEKQEVTFSEEPMKCNGTEEQVELFMGIPVIEVMVGDTTVRAFFDTGAKLSYLNPEITASYEPLGEEGDFHPTMGEFTAPVFCVPVTIAGQRVDLRCGNLPGPLQTRLMIANTSGIIGTEILSSYRVCLSYLRQKLILIGRGT